eukprot:1719903-Prymnesium_polylepis.1
MAWGGGGSPRWDPSHPGLLFYARGRPLICSRDWSRAKKFSKATFRWYCCQCCRRKVATLEEEERTLILLLQHWQHCCLWHHWQHS